MHILMIASKHPAHAKALDGEGASVLGLQMSMHQGQVGIRLVLLEMHPTLEAV